MRHQVGIRRFGGAGLFAFALCVLAATPAGAKNLLVNSSFEAGAGYRYAIGRWYENGLPNGRLDRKIKAHGAVSFRLPFSTIAFRKQGPFGIELRAATPVRLEKGRRYSFSVYLKTDVPDAKAHLAMTPLKPYEHRGKPIRDEKITLALGYTEQGFRYPWRRHVMSFTAPKSVEAYWSVRVESKRRGNLWVDALQFEEGKATAYAPAHPVEFGLVDDVLGHIHDPGKPVRFILRAYNDSARKRSHRVTVRVLDDAKRVVLRHRVTLAAGPKQGRDLPLKLDIGRRGVFLAELTVDGRPGYRQLQSFSVLPRPRPVKPARSSFGAYLTASEEAVRILARAGFHWTATLTSANRMAEWRSVEGRKGRYAWQDADVDLFRRHGFEILFNLEGFSHPRWAARLGQAERADAFARYVEAIVGHYRGRVRYFTFADEIHNKLPGSHMLGPSEAAWRTPVEYAAWHRRAHAAAKRANPDSRIVLNTSNGGLFGPDKLFKHLSPKLVDVLAGNYYPYPESVAIFKNAADRLDIKTVWAPGVAINTWPVYFRRYAGKRYDTAENLRNLTKTLIRSFASGARVFFHYTATYVGNTNVYSVFEHDSSLETGGAQFAALAWLVDGWRAARPVPVSREGRVDAYRFDRNDGTAVFAVWTSDASPKQTLRFGRGVRDVVVRDRWANALDRGGAVAAGRLSLNGGIRFLLAPAKQADALERALTGARLVLKALPKAIGTKVAGRYAFETREVGKGKRRRKQLRLWYNAGDEGWIEVLRRGVEAGGPTVAVDGGGFTLRFHYAWDGRKGHMRVGKLSSDLFWGGRFWRSMPGRGGPAWQAGRIADENLAGRLMKGTAAPAPPSLKGAKPGLAPTAYVIETARGFDLAIETAGEQPNLRYPAPGAWDIYAWRGKGIKRTIGIWRYVHGGTPRDRDIKVRVRVIPAG